MESTFHLKESRHRDNCIAEIQSLPLCQYSVEIKRLGKTPAQRALWHSIIRELANYTGFTEEQLKHKFKIDVLGFEVFKDRRGVEYQMPPATEKLNKDEYSRLIDATYTAAMKVGCNLKPATYYGLEER